MSEFYTRSDLVLRTLGKLGVRAAGQTPNAEDYDNVDGYLDGTLAALAARDIVLVNDADAIPAAFLNDIAALLAKDSASEFGVMADEMAKIDSEAAQAIVNLRIMQSKTITGQRMQAEYF